MEELVDFFLEEADELFESSNKILMEAEKNNLLESENIDALFRDIHTLKGGSGSVGLHNFAAYIHHLESFIDLLRKDEIQSSPKIIDFLIEELDLLQIVIEKDAANEIDATEFKKDIAMLNDRISELSKVEKVVEQSAEENEPKIVISRDSEFTGEFVDLFDSVLDTLNLMSDNDEFDEESIQDLFRNVHTLKGSSSFLGLNSFPIYLHDLETILDEAREHKIAYNDKLNTLIIDTMKVSEIIADQEFNETLDKDIFEKELSDMQDNFKKFKVDAQNEQEFELFDTDLSSVEEPEFELFDVDVSKIKEPEFEIFDEQKEDSGFVLFNEIETADVKPIKKDIKKEEIPKPANKKIERSKGNSIKKAASSSSIRVGLDKIDFLMNRVGDLVITKSMLYEFGEELSKTHENIGILERLSRLDREIRELQEAVMSVRMIPMESVYAKLPKTIRDLSKKLSKKVEFIHLGDSVEIDKMMVEGLSDPLTHIIRNSLDHGIELPEVRVKSKKSETGKLTISASQESGQIIIRIKDDGAGINTQRVVQKAIENGVILQSDVENLSENDKAMLIFAAGLSTAEEISDVSGRGVGMDVVMNNINSLGGSIHIDTKAGLGTEFTIVLPLTLAILDGLNVNIGKEKMILPLNLIIESLQPTQNMIKKVGDYDREILMLRNDFIPIIRLHKFFNIEPKYKDITKGMLIISHVGNTKVAIFVDDFLNQEQIVVKSLEKNYKKISGISATTIRGNGNIGLILDILSIVEEEKIQLWN